MILIFESSFGNCLLYYASRLASMLLSHVWVKVSFQLYQLKLSSSLIRLNLNNSLCY